MRKRKNSTQGDHFSILQSVFTTMPDADRTIFGTAMNRIYLSCQLPPDMLTDEELTLLAAKAQYVLENTHIYKGEYILDNTIELLVFGLRKTRHPTLPALSPTQAKRVLLKLPPNDFLPLMSTVCSDCLQTPSTDSAIE